MFTCLMAAPTVVRIRGRRFLASPLRLLDLATLLRNAGDAQGLAGDAGELPRFGDDATLGWLLGDGAGLLFHCALRGHRPRPSLGRAYRLAALASDDERAAVHRAAFRRAARPAGGGGGRSADLADHDWDAAVYRYFEEGGAMPREVAALTLDQADAIAGRGKGGEARAAANAAEWQRAYEEQAAADEAARAAEAAEAAPVSVRDLGFEFAPGERPPAAGEVADE